MQTLKLSPLLGRKCKSRPTPCNHGILQARILELVAFPFSRGSSRPKNRTGVSCIASGCLGRRHWDLHKLPIEPSLKFTKPKRPACRSTPTGFPVPRLPFQGGEPGRMHCASLAAAHDGKGAGPTRPFCVETAFRNLAWRVFLKEVGKPP